jgi:hypothetical protein
MSGIQVSTLEMVETRNASKANSELDHLFCVACYPVPMIGVPALCGAPRPTDRAYRFLDDDADLCVVCDDLAETPCKGCGS